MQFPLAIEEELNQFTADLSREDEMGAVIRAHIRIENILLLVLDNLIPNPKHLKQLRLDYDGHVTLALSLGLNERFGAPLRTLGKLRNDFAHRIDFKLSKQAVTNLYKSLSTEDKTEVQSVFSRIKGLSDHTRDIGRFSNLEPMDQFKLIAVTLWAVVQAALLLHSREISNGA